MNAASPKVSVLISTYNRPEYLSEAIESVISQEMEDFELLIMNDGGVDVTDVVESFADPRIRYFPDDENRGAAWRFNFGLKNSRGDYITYLGDDDKFYPNHLSVLSKALDEHPEVALTYSDLYAVSCIKDPDTGQRFVLDKRIQVNRDFNRDFMFFFNHVLHVSLMHRKEAAMHVGAFDKRVKVLIEWSLNRRLCFYYDFLHVPVVTGEYYMPLFKSDRISVRERKDKESYRHNLRKIKSNLPPEPWTKVKRVAVIMNVTTWDESIREKVIEIFDNLSYPFRLILVNNGAERKEVACRSVLGNLNELHNISIVSSKKKLADVAAYRLGAVKSPSDFVFLASMNFQGKKAPQRLVVGQEILSANRVDAVKWKIEEEEKGEFDLFMTRDVFLERSRPTGKNEDISVLNIKPLTSSAFKFDFHFGTYKRAYSKGKYQEAYQALKESIAVDKGAPQIQFLGSYLARSCMELGKFDEAEQTLRALIDRGYQPDNWIWLGELLKRKKEYHSAIKAYEDGLKSLGLDEACFDNHAFPIRFPKELAGFTALIGMADCYLELGDMAKASRYYRFSSKLRANSHRPFLGFAKLALDDGDLSMVEYYLNKVGPRGGKNDAEVHQLLGRLCYRQNRMDLAFASYLKVCTLDKTDEKNVDLLYYAGMKLGKWEEMKPVMEEFAAERPDSARVLARLASVHHQLGQYNLAREAVSKGLALQPENPALKNLSQRLEKEYQSPIQEPVLFVEKTDLPAPY